MNSLEPELYLHGTCEHAGTITLNTSTCSLIYIVVYVYLVINPCMCIQRCIYMYMYMYVRAYMRVYIHDDAVCCLQRKNCIRCLVITVYGSKSPNFLTCKDDPPCAPGLTLVHYQISF